MLGKLSEKKIIYDLWDILLWRVQSLHTHFVLLNRDDIPRYRLAYSEAGGLYLSVCTIDDLRLVREQRDRFGQGLPDSLAHLRSYQ